MSDSESSTIKGTVQRRDDQFANKTSTKIWLEQPSEENPYQAQASYCHGYNVLELMQKKRFSEVLFLLFQGELPEPEQCELLEQLQIALINPGPRHPATRAAMNAGIGKTDPAHILPISLIVLGGEHLGATEVEQSIRWLRRHTRKDPKTIAQQLLNERDTNQPGDIHVAPGFGSRFGSEDLMATAIAEQLLQLKGAGKTMQWAKDFTVELTQARMGWLIPGVAAAVFADLGMQPRVVPGLFQLLCAPGLYAQGIEQAPKPLTAMPFPEDSDYFIEYE